MADTQDDRDKTAESLAHTARATVRTMGRRTGETMRRGAAEGRSAAHDGIEAASDTAHDFADRSAAEFEHAADRMEAEADTMTEDMQMFLTLPRFAASTLHGAQEAIASLASRAVRANFQMTHELFNTAGPGMLFHLNRRVMRHYLREMVDGSAEALRASRRLADKALRPLDRERRHGKNIAEVMTPQVEMIGPQQSVQEAARIMAETGTGVLPVQENDRIVGMITDRDITLRVAAEGKDTKQTRVREVMTPGVRYCFADEDIEHVADNMSEQKLRRLPVMSRDKRLVGIVSLGDISSRHSHEIAGRALGSVAQASGDAAAQRQFAGDKPGERAGAAQQTPDLHHAPE